MSINNMIEQFKDFSDLKLFAESQYKTILQLSKKITQLEDENKHLKDLLQKNTPIIEPDLKSDKLILLNGASDQEIICRTQLRILKDTALLRELTLEETRKTETFTKVLLSLTQGGKKPESELEKLNDKELLSLLENEVNEQTK